MKRQFVLFAMGLGLAGAVLGAAGWCVVAPGEVVVVRRLGRRIGPPWGPGLHWRFPLGIDRLDRVRADAVRQLTIGRGGIPGADAEPSAGEVLTGDLNLLRVQATIQYRVSNPVPYILEAEPAEPLLARAAEASLTRALAHRGVEAVLRSDRRAIAREAEHDLQARCHQLSLGVTILSVSLTEAHPPLEVAGDFAAAQSAESHRDRRINEAKTYEAVQVTGAESQRQSALESAWGDAGRTVLAARAESQHFLVLMTEVHRARDLTIRRLYMDSIQRLLEGVRRKLILPAGDSLDLTVLGTSGAVAPSSSPAQAPAPGAGGATLPGR